MIDQVSSQPIPKRLSMAEFLATLPDKPQRGLSRAEIQAHVERERQ
jgi:hypothetical protein